VAAPDDDSALYFATVRLLSPLGSALGNVRSLSRRRPSLQGLRVGVLDNSKPNADVLLGRVAELLAAEAPGVTIRRWTKPGSSRPAAMIEEIAAASDVVLTGSAD
jgi:hypothetical protein